MRWLDLAFLHWPVKVAQLRDLVPRGLAIDTYEDQAWVGVVPFRMARVRPRWGPPIPGLSAFPEINVRTYVTIDGKPGVWFFSLDTTSKLTVRGARVAFHLPYFDARMSVQAAGDTTRYSSTRTHRGAPSADFLASYRPTGDAFQAKPGTLEHFLTARYCLYSADRAGQIYRGEINHLSWPLCNGEAEIETNTMASAAGISLPDTKPLVHHSRLLDVVAWNIQRV